MSRSVGRILAVLTVVVAPAVVVAWTAPTWWPHIVDALTGLVGRPLTAETLLVLAAAAAGLLWAILAVAVTIEILARTSRSERAQRWRFPGPLQVAVSGLLGAYALTRATHPAAPDHASQDAPLGPAEDGPDSNIPHSASSEATTAARQGAPGLVLADGSWIPRPLADAVTAAATTVWYQRRRDYRPDPHGRTRHLGLDPLPPTAVTVQAIVEADDTASIPTDTRPGRLLHPRELQPGGIGLVGPGALDAARGLIVTLLLEAGSADIVTTRDTLHELFPPPHSEATVPGLRKINAITDLPDTPQETGEPAPGTMLVALAPEEHGSRQHLADLLADTKATAVLVGPWPPGRTWHVDADGYIHPTSDNDGPRRFCTLSPQTASDLLQLATTVRAQTPPTTTAEARPRYAAPPAQEAQQPVVQVRTLGQPELRYQQTAIVPRRSAAWQLLIYLAVHPEGATSYQLAKAIWPWEHPHATVKRLYTTASALRGQIIDAGAPPVIERDGTHYRLLPTTDVDLWHLMAAIDHATHPASQDDQLHAWRTVTDLYRGELATGHRWPWLQPHREQIRRAVLDAYVGLADHADQTTALDLLHHAAAVDPTNAYLRHRLNSMEADDGSSAAATPTP